LWSASLKGERIGRLVKKGRIVYAGRSWDCDKGADRKKTPNYGQLAAKQVRRGSASGRNKEKKGWLLNRAFNGLPLKWKLYRTVSG